MALAVPQATPPLTNNFPKQTHQPKQYMITEPNHNSASLDPYARAHAFETCLEGITTGGGLRGLAQHLMTRGYALEVDHEGPHVIAGDTVLTLKELGLAELFEAMLRVQEPFMPHHRDILKARLLWIRRSGFSEDLPELGHLLYAFLTEVSYDALDTAVLEATEMLPTGHRDERVSLLANFLYEGLAKSRAQSRKRAAA